MDYRAKSQYTERLYHAVGAFLDLRMAEGISNIPAEAQEITELIEAFTAFEDNRPVKVTKYQGRRRK